MDIIFSLTLIEKMLLAAIPATGFAMVFNVPFQALKYCALLGAIGYSFRIILIEINFSITWASFYAAILIGIIGIQWSRWWLIHPKVFTVAAIIPMFPGINAYVAMMSLVKIAHFGYNTELLETLVTYFIKTLFIVGALSVGLSIPGLWLYRKRPRV